MPLRNDSGSLWLEILCKLKNESLRKSRALGANFHRPNK